MLEAHVKQPAGEPDPFECVVLDVKARAPGFYTAAWRTYYVAGAGTVYLLRAPGQRATLLQLDDLPDGADPDSSAGHDRVLALFEQADDMMVAAHCQSEVAGALLRRLRARGQP